MGGGCIFQKGGGVGEGGGGEGEIKGNKKNCKKADLYFAAAHLEERRGGGGEGGVYGRLNYLFHAWECSVLSKSIV